jgi:hypothetical protein
MKISSRHILLMKPVLPDYRGTIIIHTHGGHSDKRSPDGSRCIGGGWACAVQMVSDRISRVISFAMVGYVECATSAGLFQKI